MADAEIEILSNALSFDSSTGKFYWKIASGQSSIGKIAGTPSKNGYLQIKYRGKKYLSHRLAWALHYGTWPTSAIDHVNGHGEDNRICNLRLASSVENGRNQKRCARNTSGYKGVTEIKGRGLSKPFRASIDDGTRYVHLGYFETAEKAHAAYMVAAKEFFGEFARAA